MRSLQENEQLFFPFFLFNLTKTSVSSPVRVGKLLVRPPALNLSLAPQLSASRLPPEKGWNKNLAGTGDASGVHSCHIALICRMRSRFELECRNIFLDAIASPSSYPRHVLYFSLLSTQWYFLQPFGRLLVELKLLVPQVGVLLCGGVLGQVGDLLPQVCRLLQGISKMGLAQCHLQQSCLKEMLYRAQCSVKGIFLGRGGMRYSASTNICIRLRGYDPGFWKRHHQVGKKNWLRALFYATFISILNNHSCGQLDMLHSVHLTTEIQSFSI